MRRKPFLIFSLVMLVLITGVIAFIQSAQFAVFLKRGLVKYLPSDLGISADFSELSIGILPPSLSLKNPLIEVSERNSADLPAGSRIRAERLEMRFLPFQIFAGNVRISQLAVVNGEVFLPLDLNHHSAHTAAKRKGLGISWSDLLQIRVDSFALENTRLQFEMKDPQVAIALVAESAAISQAEVTGGAGYELSLKVRDVQARLPKSWNTGDLQLDRIDGLATVSAKEFRLVGLEVDGLGAKAKTSLAIHGDILKTTDLPAVGDLELTGNLPVVVSKLFPKFDPQGEFSGKLRFGGKVEARLNRIAETLKARGQFTVNELRFRNWRADEVQVEGGFELPAEGGAKISVTRAVATAAERPRIGGHQPASGGKVEISAFEWHPGTGEPLNLALKIDKAHVQWLGAAALKEVYPLDFRASGDIAAVFQPAWKEAPWSLDAQLNLKIPQFQLDNQKFGAERPLHTIIKVPGINLQGSAHFDAQEFRPENLLVSLAKTKLGVTGKIDFKNGYDLSAAGPVDFSDFESIAGSPIKGEGSLALHVHGPASAVLLDFDTRLSGAEYLGLRLGSMQGRITYDDGPTDLLFKQVELEKGRTKYEVDGKLAMGDVESVNLDVKIPKGRYEELGDIFSKLTDPISWYPRSLVGDVSGTAKVTGKPDFALLEIRTDLAGTDWDYLGERFRDVKVKGGYVRGKYVIDSFSARKQDARVAGSISYDSSPGAGEYTQWDLATQGLEVQSFDHILRMDFPMRGQLEAHSSGKGKSGAIESQSDFAIRNLNVRGQPFLDSHLSVRTANGKLQMDGQGFGGQGEIAVGYDWKPGATSHVHVALKSLDFSPMLLLMNPKLGQDHALAGRITGKLDLGFASGAAELASGEGELSDYVLAKSGSTWNLAGPVAFHVANGTFEPVRIAIRGAGQESNIRLKGTAGRIEGTVGGFWSASVLEFFNSTIEQASGPIAVEGKISGRWKEPEVSGSARFDGVSVKTTITDSPFEGLQGTVRLVQNVISIDRLDADLANGRFSAGGNVTLFSDRVPELELNAQINSSRIKVYPFQFVKIRGKYQIHGKELPYLIEGTTVADSGLIKEKIMNSTVSQGVKTAKYTPPPARRDYADLPKFKLDVEFKADRGILIQNDLFDAELRADMRLVNTVDNPRPIGTAEILSGKLIFKDKSFIIQSGSARFDSPVAINPAFNLNASTDINTTKIQLFASGRMSDYHIELSSNPSLPESEILSLLTIGVSGDEARRMRSSTTSGFEQGEAASLLLNSLNFNRDVQNKTGFDIQIGEVSDQSLTATSVSRSRNEADTSASPKIVIRRTIGKNLVVSGGSTVGVGNTSQKEVNLEYQITPGMSVNGVWDNTEGIDMRSTNPYNLGVDLKLEKRFK